MSPMNNRIDTKINSQEKFISSCLEDFKRALHALFVRKTFKARCDLIRNKNNLWYQKKLNEKQT